MDEPTEIARKLDEASKAAELQDHDADASRADRIINKVVEVAGVAVLATIVLLVFVNAVGRYALSFTFIWIDEVVLGLLPWAGMLGMFLSIRRRQIIRIEYFLGLFPVPLHKFVHVLGSLLAAGAFCYLAITSVEYLNAFGSDRTIYLGLRKGWFMSAMVIGPALAALAYVLMVLQDLREGKDDENPR